ncbi:very short patch repair endonuclease [Demequina lignilytica]|uniref:very short patch repair endonuclease n=1 Tax=Demequina lignilytica TaxID=3051663 RepID=UPI003F731523
MAANIGGEDTERARHSGSRTAESWATTEGVRAAMRANRKRDTAPELAVRRIVHASGLRYRVAAAPIRGVRRTADLLFRPTKVAVFIDGCFWHSCPIHATSPQAHSDYWLPKLERNRERDAETNAILEAAGWTVLRFWEHEDPTEVAATVVAVVTERRIPRSER